MQVKAKPASRTWFYQFARMLLVVFTAVFYPCKAYNLEAFQKDAPYILIANHQSLMDPLLLAAKMKRYEIYYIGKRELTKFKPLGWLVKKLHMIAVSRHESDLTTMRAATKVLKDGEVLGLFPEGTRYHHGIPMAHIESGASLLALRSQVSLLPVLIYPRPRLFRLTYLYIGEEIDYQDLTNQGVSKEISDELNKRIQRVFWDMYEKTNKKQNA